MTSRFGPMVAIPGAGQSGPAIMVPSRCAAHQVLEHRVGAPGVEVELGTLHRCELHRADRQVPDEYCLPALARDADDCVAGRVAAGELEVHPGRQLHRRAFDRVDCAGAAQRREGVQSHHLGLRVKEGDLGRSGHEPRTSGNIGVQVPSPSTAAAIPMPSRWVSTTMSICSTG